MSKNEMDPAVDKEVDRVGGPEAVDRIGDWLMRCLAIQGASDLDENARTKAYQEILNEVTKDASLNEEARKLANETVRPFIQVPVLKA